MAGTARSLLILLLTALVGVARLPLPTCVANNVLYAGETLRAGSALTWESYHLRMQRNGNLVLYDAGNKVWASNTRCDFDSDGFRCIMQENGHFAVYTNEYHPVFVRPKHWVPQGRYVLVLQDNRNVAIYGPVLWSARNKQTTMTTATMIVEADQTKLMGSSSTTTEPPTRNIVYSHRGKWIHDENPLRWGPYKLTLEICDLVLYKGEEVLWRTDNGITYPKAHCSCTLMPEGNLVVNQDYGDRSTIWESGSKRDPKGKYVLILQKDGDLVIYGNQRWSTGTYIRDQKAVLEINGTATI